MDLAPEEVQGLLTKGAAELGLSLEEPLLRRFCQYLAELKRWNARVNLTGLTADRDIIIRHFLDSLAILPFLGEARVVADIGSGAGFPGLVLKLARPDLHLTLVESRGKKAAFLDYLVSLWGLEGVEIAPVYLTPRLAAAWGPRFEAALSRATLKLKDFLAVAAPLLLPGGRALALKGPHLPEAEWRAGEAAAGRLGLAPLEQLAYRLPVTGESRLVVLARRPGPKGNES
ncbi:MAG: 16S rRNA (guanine(527)-N(7))-methyltransferase RsmG [Desulfobaccales bacterium]